MRWRGWIAMGFILLIVGTGLYYFVRPAPIRVEIATVTQGLYRQTVDEDGRARVRNRYIVTAPLDGTLSRITLKEGDPVTPGSFIATIQPKAAPILDPRTRAELNRRLDLAEAERLRAASILERSRAALILARTKLDRSNALLAKGYAPQARVDEDQAIFTTASRDVDAAEFALHAAEHAVELARAALAQSGEIKGGETSSAPEHIDILSPVPGEILRIVRTDQGPILLGAPLVEIADTHDLEIISEILTTDAAQIDPGDPVIIDGWGGNALAGKVRLVEPMAFTKVSALGVEEQRVNVIMDITAPPDTYRTLSDGFRVDVHVIIYQAENAVLVPNGALFQSQEDWFAFTVDANGRARKQKILLGHKNGEGAEVLQGLTPGDKVIVYPSDAIADGVRVAPLITTQAQ